MKRFVVVIMILVVIGFTAITLLHAQTDASSLKDCPVQYPGLERSWFKNVPLNQIKNIPNQNVLDLVDKACKTYQLVNSNRNNSYELHYAQREYAESLQVVMAYWPKPIFLFRTDLEDNQEWLEIVSQELPTDAHLVRNGTTITYYGADVAIARNCDDSQIWNDCEIVSVIQYKEIGNTTRKRVFNYLGLLITSWQSIGA